MLHDTPLKKIRLHPFLRLFATVAVGTNEVCVWTWNDTLQPQLLLRIPAPFPIQEASIAWHPGDNLLAIVGGGRRIELWDSDGSSRVIGCHPVPDAKLDIGEGRFLPFKIEEQGYSTVSFIKNGEQILALYSGTGEGDGCLQVLDTSTGECHARLPWGDSYIRFHPHEETYAALNSSQVVSNLEIHGFPTRSDSLIARTELPADGYNRIEFSADGRYVVVIGNAYITQVYVFRYPSLEMIQEWNLGSLQKLKEAVAHGINSAPLLGSFQIARTGWVFTQGLSGIPDALTHHPSDPGFLAIAEGGSLIHLNPESQKGISKVKDFTISEHALSLDARATDSLLAVCGSNGEVALHRLGSPKNTG